MSTTVKTGWLNDKNGDKFAPKTLTSQVQTSDGILLEDKIQADLNLTKNEISESIAEINTSISSSLNEAKLYSDTNLDIAKNYTDNIVSDLASASHIHEISDITNLQSSLDEVNNTVSQKSQVQLTTFDGSGSITEVLPTLKIHKLTQEQYDEAVENGDLEEGILYLTPDKENDLSKYATIESLESKADVNHAHDDIYYTQTQIDTLLERVTPTEHTHTIDNINGLQDILDIKASQVDLDVLTSVVDNKADASHSHNDLYYTEAEINELLLAKSDEGHNHNDVYDMKGAAEEALRLAESYTDNVANIVKDDLLNVAGEAYDTLKELGDLINENVNAIEALEIIASEKADASHTHNDIYNTKNEIETKISTINTSISNSLNEAKLYSDTNLNIAKNYADNITAQKSQVQIITWEDDD